MPALTITKNWADGSALTEAHLDAIKNGVETLLNTTKLDGDNIQDAGIAQAKLTSALLSLLAPTGQISAYAGSSAPTGYLLCDGSAVSRSTYSTLFGIVSTTYGVGDGATTFNVPDLRGRAPIGVGTGTGLTARALAATVGAETVTLDATTMPTHTHSVTDPGHTHTITQLQAGGGGASVICAQTSSVSNAGGAYSTASGVTGISLANTGSGGAHANMQPSLALNFIIKT